MSTHISRLNPFIIPAAVNSGFKIQVNSTDVQLYVLTWIFSLIKRECNYLNNFNRGGTNELYGNTM